MGLTLQDWFRGDTPAGFKRRSADEIQMIVREELEAHLAPKKLRERMRSEKEESLFYGRGRLRLFQMDDGQTLLVRPYRHGGFFRYLMGSLFFDRPPRPFQELAITEEARRRGVQTLEICGAWIERAWGPFYRGWLISRVLADAQDLWAALQKGLYAGGDRKLLLQAVGQSVRRMHLRGIYHRDLNLKNIMVRRENGKVTAYIIDFDKARIFSGEVSRKRAQRNLRRLLRSVRKLDPQRRHLSQEDWDLFIRFYREAAEA